MFSRSRNMVNLALNSNNSQRIDEDENEDFSSDTCSEYKPDSDVDSDEEERETVVRRNQFEDEISISCSLDKTVNDHHSNQIQSEDGNLLPTSSVGETENHINNIASNQSEALSENGNENENLLHNNIENNCQPGQSLQTINKKRRHANPASWKKNVVKNLRVSGQEYTNRAGKLVPARKPRFIDCSLCRFKCSIHFNEMQRENICKEYWALKDTSKQKQFLSSLIITKEVARRRNDVVNPKGVSKEYHLRATGGSLVRVCLRFLCSTISISHRTIDDLNLVVTNTGNYLPREGGAQVVRRPANATKESVINAVKAHIDSFPRVESHYCRRDSQKLYLASDLNLSKMHRLYLEIHNDGVSLFVYRNFFNSYEPQLSFFTPKKDQCVKCNIYYAAIDKSMLEADWRAHKHREETSMTMKKLDKQKAVDGKGIEYRSISFDLQSILSTPFAAEAEIYYKRKLNVYNFTIYDNYNRDGFCYVWDECNGQKGSNEIGTCILRYISSLPSSVSHISSFSDTCGGQNRNKHVYAAMLYAVNNFNNIKCIDLKYMESGHSYLEADAMHGTIERARKHKKVYTTREWALLISAARMTPRPFNVTILKHSDFYNLKTLSNIMLHNTNKNINKEQVNWLKIKWLRFSKEHPISIFYKYDLCDEEFLEIDITKKRNAQVLNWHDVNLEQAYTQMLHITAAKKKDLLSLLSAGVIPSDYKSFYESLPSSGRVPARDEEFDEEDD